MLFRSDGDLTAGETVTAGAITVGSKFIIQSVGTTNFTLIGASSNTVGTIFTATGAGTGTGVVSALSSQGTGTVIEQQQFDYGPFDFNEISASINYSFTVQAFDGANYDTQTYLLQVQSRTGWTADNTTSTVDDSYISADSGNVYLPVITNTTTTLPVGRQNSYYAFKIDGYDFSGDTITYSVTPTAGTFDAGGFDPLNAGAGNNGMPGSFDLVGNTAVNLPGVILDQQSGWIYGKLATQTAAIQDYTFGITVSKVVNGQTYNSNSTTFTLPVLGDVNNTVNWVTPSDLGSIDNGSVSELSVVAVSELGTGLVYSLLDQSDVSVRLPQGLTLLPSGEISGRVSFEAFSIDGRTITFDGGSTTVDTTYTFTVLASTVDGTASSTREFTVKLNIVDQNPYVNLYLTASPSHSQINYYNSIINNTEIFNPAYIYRPTDPWFGVNTSLEMLFLSGLNTATLEEYQQAIALNH